MALLIRQLNRVHAAAQWTEVQAEVRDSTRLHAENGGGDKQETSPGDGSHAPEKCAGGNSNPHTRTPGCAERVTTATCTEVVYVDQVLEEYERSSDGMQDIPQRESDQRDNREVVAGCFVGMKEQDNCSVQQRWALRSQTKATAVGLRLADMALEVEEKHRGVLTVVVNDIAPKIFSGDKVYEAFMTVATRLMEKTPEVTLGQILILLALGYHLIIKNNADTTRMLGLMGLCVLRWLYQSGVKLVNYVVARVVPTVTSVCRFILPVGVVLVIAFAGWRMYKAAVVPL